MVSSQLTAIAAVIVVFNKIKSAELIISHNLILLLLNITLENMIWWGVRRVYGKLVINSDKSRYHFSLFAKA